MDLHIASINAKIGYKYTQHRRKYKFLFRNKKYVNVSVKGQIHQSGKQLSFNQICNHLSRINCIPHIFPKKKEALTKTGYSYLNESKKLKAQTHHPKNTHTRFLKHKVYNQTSILSTPNPIQDPKTIPSYLFLISLSHYTSHTRFITKVGESLHLFTVIAAIQASHTHAHTKRNNNNNKIKDSLPLSTPNFLPNNYSHDHLKLTRCSSSHQNPNPKIPHNRPPNQTKQKKKIHIYP